MEVMILNFNQFENQNFFNGNPSDTFKDLGKQVFNYFSTPSFHENGEDKGFNAFVTVWRPG